MKHLLPVYTFNWLWFTLLLFSSSYAFGQTYCTPQYNFVDCNTLQRRAYITNVSLNNRTFSTGCSQAGYAGIVNRTSSGADDPIVVDANYGYTMTVNTYEYDSRTYYSVYNQVSFAVWIDYNKNGSFETSEQIANSTSPTFTFNVNSSAGGNYRMRIRTRSNPYVHDPCSTQDYGETEDYLLKIIPLAPGPNLGENQYPCAHVPFTLSASGCPSGTIQWWEESKNSFVGNNPVTTQINQRSTYIYYAICTIDGATSLRSRRVYVMPTTVPPAAISSNNYNLTVGQTATLTATGNLATSEFGWSNGQKGNPITVAPIQTTTYSVTYVYSSRFTGCYSPKSNEITITVNAPSAPSVSANKNTVCPNEAVTLTAGSCGGTIRWSTGASGSSTTVYPSQTTEYSASCFIGSVESPKAYTKINVTPATTITRQPGSLAVCEGSQASFDVGANGTNLTYLWSKDGMLLLDTIAPQMTLRNVTPSNNGKYRVRVSGTCGVVQSNEVTIQVSPRMNLTTSTQSAVCSGDANGAITITVTGGVGNNNYQIADQSNYQPSNTIGGLRAGTYTVRARDEFGCSAEAKAEVGQPAPITFKVSSINTKCADGSDGAVDVIAEGGNGNFKYSINNGQEQTNTQFKDLKAYTTYVIKAIDSKGCSANTSAYIDAPSKIVVSFNSKQVRCNGENTGEIAVSASGGNSVNYQFQTGQNTPQTGSTFGGLKAGTYTITVTDNVGCTGKADVVVTEPTPVQLRTTSTLVSCIHDSSASINATASGGVAPYQYKVGNRAFQTDNVLKFIRQGSFWVTAKDANGCEVKDSISVNKAPTLLLDVRTYASSCCTCPDGGMNLISSGGIGTRQYQLNQSAFNRSDTLNRLTSGQYVVTVRDETGCSTSKTVTVSNATAATLVLTNVKNVNCAGGKDGSATVRVTGGQEPFTYTWQTKNPTDSLGAGVTASRLPEGEFTVMVTDKNRCTVPISGTLTAQNPIPPKPTITQSGGNLISSAQSGVQWYSGFDVKTGKLVANATQATFTPFESNSFYVVATVNGCISPASEPFSFILTALETVLSLSLQIVPNPVTERLRLEIDQPIREAVTIQLIDLMGKHILNVQIPAFSGHRQFEWEIPQASAGMYLLRAESATRRTTQRVIVQ